MNHQFQTDLPLPEVKDFVTHLSTGSLVSATSIQDAWIVADYGIYLLTQELKSRAPEFRFGETPINDEITQRLEQLLTSVEVEAEEPEALRAISPDTWKAILKTVLQIIVQVL